jgi:hypothetical protein
MGPMGKGFHVIQLGEVRPASQSKAPLSVHLPGISWPQSHTMPNISTTKNTTRMENNMTFGLTEVSLS